MMPHALCKTMPSNPFPWLAMTTEVFPPWCQVGAPACLWLVRNSISNQNQARQVKPYLAHRYGLAALPLGYLLYLMKDKNHRCVECLSKCGNTMKDSCRAMTAKFREYIMTHGWWWYWFSLMGWLISVVTSSPGCFYRNHREEENCGNNTHSEPIKSQMCLSKWTLSHRKEGFSQWLD